MSVRPEVVNVKPEARPSLQHTPLDEEEEDEREEISGPMRHLMNLEKKKAGTSLKETHLRKFKDFDDSSRSYSVTVDDGDSSSISLDSEAVGRVDYFVCMFNKLFKRAYIVDPESKVCCNNPRFVPRWMGIRLFMGSLVYAIPFILPFGIVYWQQPLPLVMMILSIIPTLYAPRFAFQYFRVRADIHRFLISIERAAPESINTKELAEYVNGYYSIGFKKMTMLHFILTTFWAIFILLPALSTVLQYYSLQHHFAWIFSIYVLFIALIGVTPVLGLAFQYAVFSSFYIALELLLKDFIKQIKPGLTLQKVMRDHSLICDSLEISNRLSGKSFFFDYSTKLITVILGITVFVSSRPQYNWFILYQSIYVMIFLYARLIQPWHISSTLSHVNAKVARVRARLGSTYFTAKMTPQEVESAIKAADMESFLMYLNSTNAAVKWAGIELTGGNISKILSLVATLLVLTTKDLIIGIGQN